MSGIQGLSPEQQQVYNQLISDAGSVNVSKVKVDAKLQEVMDAGLSFQEAADQVRNDLPPLPAPQPTAPNALGGWVGVASPMASINALITELSAEQRRENREVMKAQTDTIVASMENQADEIRKKATAQLACGVVSGVISITSGGMMVGGTIAGNIGKLDMKNNTAGMGLGNIGQGVSGIVSSVGTFVGAQYDASMKEMEADQERMRASRDALKSINDSLSEVIQKSISTQDAIQQNMNQTRSRILG